MESIDLFERSKNRRVLAALALHRLGSSKQEWTPDELRKKISSVKEIRSKFGGRFDQAGQPAGKAGRTLAFIENWLQHKGEHGLPPVGKEFESFVRVNMDRANHIWGHEDAVEDIAHDIHYNYGFDPRDITLVEAKVPEVADANCMEMPKIISSVKPFFKKADTSYTPPAITPQQAYEVPKKDDPFKMGEVPVVTRVDYYGDTGNDKMTAAEAKAKMDAAKAKSQFPVQQFWNKRNVAANDLLEDLSTADYDKKDIAKDERPFSKTELYPKDPTGLNLSVKGFVKKN